MRIKGRKQITSDIHKLYYQNQVHLKCYSYLRNAVTDIFTAYWWVEVSNSSWNFGDKIFVDVTILHCYQLNVVDRTSEVIRGWSDVLVSGKTQVLQLFIEK